MNIRLIRSACNIVTYAGKKFLIDPWLSDKAVWPAFPFTYNQDKQNPMVGLPVSIDEIIKVDAVIVTHMHPDHFDDVAMKVIPKDMKMFVQSEVDAATLKDGGFKDVEVVKESGINFGDITLYKTLGEHGRGDIVEDYMKKLGVSGTKEVMGVVLKNPNEKTFYIAGDTIWCEYVQDAISKYNPDVILLFAGYAQFVYGGPIIMGKYEVLEVFKAAPNAKIITTHLETVNHGLLTRKELKEYISEKGMTGNVLVPDDGETIAL